MSSGRHGLPPDPPGNCAEHVLNRDESDRRRRRVHHGRLMRALLAERAIT